MLSRSLRLLLTLLLLGGGASSCTRLNFDPNAGAETVYLQTLQHADTFDLEYMRTPEEGPLILEKNAWTLLWFIPLNTPDMGLWLEQNLPVDAEAANVRASVKTPWFGHLLFFPTLGLVRVERVRFQADPVIFKLPVSDPK